MTDGIERRTLETHELRASDEGGGRVLVGYAAKFNARSERIGDFYEEIAPGAFAGVLGNDVRALYNHDPNMVLGRSTTGTLRLEEDAQGLRVAITLPETSYAQDLWTLVQRGDVSQMSFGFTVGKSGQEWRKEGGQAIRRITQVSRLIDVSPVTYPAYPQTAVQARDIEAALAAAADNDNEVDDPTIVNDTGAPDAVPTHAAQRTRTLRLLSI